MPNSSPVGLFSRNAPTPLPALKSSVQLVLIAAAMIPHGSSTCKQAVCHQSPADGEPGRINLTEEAVERAPTLENFGIVTETTSPCYFGTTQTTTTDGMQRDSQSEPRQLPDEILIEIIHWAASNPLFIDRDTEILTDPKLLKSLTSYRQVCKRWKILVDGTASLWAFLSADDAPSVEAFQRVIEKSGNAPLTICCGEASMWFQHFADMVTPQMHRCRALLIRTMGEDVTRALKSLFSQPCPILEKLHFDTAYSWSLGFDGVDSGLGHTSFDIWVLRHNAQRLKSLRLAKLTGPGWAMGSNLTNLRELTLDSPMIWFKSLMECLAGSPLLHTLTINRSQLCEMYKVPESATTVELAFLTRIELRNASASFVHALLSHISPPSLNQLVLSIGDFDVPIFPLGEVGPAYHALLLSLLKAQGAEPIPILVEVWLQRLSLTDDQTGREFELLGEPIWPDGHVLHFVQSLSNISRYWSKISSLSFTLLLEITAPYTQFEGIHITQECLRPLVDMEGVTEIRLGDTAGNVQYLYQLLSDAVDGEYQPRRWLAPRLAVLAIVAHQNHDTALVQMVENRYGTTITVNEDTFTPLPLSQLILLRHSSEVPEPQIADKIRSTIGEEHFCLDVYH